VTRNRLWQGLRRFRDTDRGLSILLALLVIVVFVLPAASTPRVDARFAGDLAFSALLIAGAVATSERRWIRFAVAVLVAAALLVRWVANAAPADSFAIGREASTLVTLLAFAAVVAAEVFRRGAVNHHRILGAVAVYLLIGLAWASACELLHVVHPGAFSGALPAEPVPQTWIYYSFVTLTTMGYGDITPVHPVARSLAIAEAVIGQLYLAITLARLVSLRESASDHRK